MRSVLGALVITAAVAVSGPASAAPEARPAPPRFSPGEIVVKFEPDVSRARRSTLRSGVGTRSAGLGVAGLEVVKLRPDENVADAVEELESRPGVLYAEPNYLYELASTVPDDYYFPQLWGLQNRGDVDIDAPEVWDHTRGSSDVVVAVVDGGVAHDHPDLAPNMWRNPGETGGGRESNQVDDDGNGYVDDVLGWDWVDEDRAPSDFDGHGTHVAGTIGARGNDDFGTTGVNWRVSLMALRAMGSDGYGTTSDVAAAFSYAERNGADVVNASFGGPIESRALQDVIAASSDVLFVAAAGNDSWNNDVRPDYPCNYPLPNVLCVAAHGRDGGLADYSNFGAATVDLTAPGSAILSTMPSLREAWSEDFEFGMDGWVTGGDVRWSLGEDDYGFFASDSPYGNYRDASDSWIQTASPLPLSNGCSLGFAVNGTVGPGDTLDVEASRGGGQWTKFDSFTSDTEGQWEARRVDLSVLGGEAFVRFRLTTDDVGNADGTSIDDVTLTCLTDRYDEYDYANMSGTSMAAPHVAGTAALLKSAAPDARATEIAVAIVGGVTPDGSRGITTSGGRLDAYEALRRLVPDLGGVDPGPGTTHARSVSLESRRRSLVGRIAVADGYRRCLSQTRVTILRDGRRFKSVDATRRGTFSVLRPRGPGRYRALVAASDLPSGDSCAAARSRSLRVRR